MGDYFSSKYGLLQHPVIFEISGGRVKTIHSDNVALAEEVALYFDSDPNGRRVGEFAIGTNIGLQRLVGNLLQDEKFPGIHIAFGSPLPHITAATWTSRIHVDVIPTQCTIDVESRRLMTDGIFEPDILAGLP